MLVVEVLGGGCVVDGVGTVVVGVAGWGSRHPEAEITAGAAQGGAATVLSLVTAVVPVVSPGGSVVVVDGAVVLVGSGCAGVFGSLDGRGRSMPT